MRLRVPSAALPDTDLSFLDKNPALAVSKPFEIRFPAVTDIPGCSFGAFSHLSRELATRVKPRLYSLMGGAQGRLEAMHREHAGDGLCLLVSKGVQAALPLRFETRLEGTDSAAFYPHHLIVLEAGARATLVEELRGDGNSVLHNGVTEIILEEGAELDYVVFQDLPLSCKSFSFEFIRLGKDAKICFTHVEMGASSRRVEINCEASSPGSSTRLNGVYYGKKTQALETAIALNHLSQNTESDIFWKSAVTDSARTNFVGEVMIAPGADKTRAFQTTNNLLLSKQAKASPDPRLEILADDVQAKHAATVSYLDEDSKFYLRSRGITSAQAAQMLTMAFFSDALQRLRPEIHQEAIVRLQDAMKA